MLDLLELARLYVILSRLFLVGVGKKLVLDTEFRSQERVNEGNIIMNSTHFKDLLSSQTQVNIPFPLPVEIVTFVIFLAEFAGIPAVLDVAQQLQAEFVRIDPRAVHRHRSRMMIRKIDDLGRV